MFLKHETHQKKHINTVLAEARYTYFAGTVHFCEVNSAEWIHWIHSALFTSQKWTMCRVN